MIDPWAGLRARPDYHDIPMSQTRMLLTDADALLAVAVEATEWRMLRGRLVFATEIELGEALDALPEHLQDAVLAALPKHLKSGDWPDRPSQPEEY